MSVLSHIRHALYGEEPLTIRISRAKLREGKVFIPVESKYRGYQLKFQKSKLVITRRNLWRLFVGLPALYHFAGTVNSSNNESATVSGVVTMMFFPRVFLSLWFGLVFLIMGIVFILALLLTCKLMYSPTSVSKDDIVGVWFVLGGGGIVLFFGVLFLQLLKVLNRGERQRLIEFCTTQE